MEPGTEKRFTCTSSGDIRIAPILFAIWSRRNKTGYSHSVLVLGREINKPGDWIISLGVLTSIDDINEARLNREQAVPGTEKLTANPPERSWYSAEDTVFYKAHLSKASKGFSRGIRTRVVGAHEARKAGLKRSLPNRPATAEENPCVVPETR